MLWPESTGGLQLPADRTGATLRFMSNTPAKGTILIVSDGKAGHEQQSRALCAGMGFDCEVVHVGYRAKWRKGLSYGFDWLGIAWSGLFCQSGAACAPGKFSAVVATGSTAFYPARVLARKLAVPVIAVLSPRGYRLGGFDCILSPGFDRLPPRDNVVVAPVNLTQVGDDFYTKGVTDFEARFVRDPQRKALGVVIGGPNKFTRMPADNLRRQLTDVFTATEGMTRWVTTSRRTPPDVEQVIRDMDFDYRLIFREDTFNPIPAFVMLCDTICVTSDSTGMISEAVTRGTSRVEILVNPGKRGTKFERFIDDLQDMNCVHRFNGRPGDARRKIDLQPVMQQVAEKTGLDK